MTGDGYIGDAFAACCASPARRPSKAQNLIKSSLVSVTLGDTTGAVLM